MNEAAAQTFTGEGFLGGLWALNLLNFSPNQSLRSLILNLLFTVLSFVGLLAVVVLVITSIMLILSLGNEEALTRTKKVFLNVAVGLIVIIISDSLVVLFSTLGN